jgi:predicted RNase H-like HicB family nuclease
MTKAKNVRTIRGIGNNNWSNADIAQYMKLPYARIIVPDTEGYSAKILEFKGCFAEGDTIEEVAKSIEECAAHWLEDALEQGLEIPIPYDWIDETGNFSKWIKAFNGVLVR